MPGAAIRGEDDPGWELDTPLTRGEGSDPELTD